MKLPDDALVGQRANPHSCFATSVAHLPPNDAIAAHHWSVLVSVPLVGGLTVIGSDYFCVVFHQKSDYFFTVKSLRNSIFKFRIKLLILNSKNHGSINTKLNFENR